MNMDTDIRGDGWHPYRPTEIPAPGETLRETLESLDMSQSKLASRTGLTLKHINQIIQGNAAISPETSLALERVTGVEADFWNSLEARFQDHRVREEEAARLGKHEEWLQRMPLSALRKLGYIHSDKRKAGALLQEALAFFGVGSIEAWEKSWNTPAAAFLQSTAFDADAGAVAAWLRLGELQAKDIDCAPFDRVVLRRVLPALRALTVKQPKEFFPELVALCATAGVCVVLVPEVTGARASGASRFISPSKALIQLSNRGKRNDKFWFALFHELGHLLLHGKKELFVEFTAPTANISAAEAEANEFASSLLIPKQYEDQLRAIKTPRDAVELAETIGVAPAIVAGRYQRETEDWRFGPTLFQKLEITSGPTSQPSSNG